MHPSPGFPSTPKMIQVVYLSLIQEWVDTLKIVDSVVVVLMVV